MCRTAHLCGIVCAQTRIGEELGLTEANLSLEEMRDPFGIAYWPEFRGRDGSRTPLPWDATLPHAGFTEAEAPWLPVAPEHHALSVASQEADPDSLLQDWRRFLQFRREHRELIVGRQEMVDLPEPCFGFLRSHGSERMLCLFNLSDTEIRVDLRVAGLKRKQILPPYGAAFHSIDARVPMPKYSFTAGD